MNENSRRVLEMLAEVKVSVDEAERLLSLVDEGPEAATTVQTLAPPRPGVTRYLRVTVDSDEDEHVDVRVPLALIKAGIRLHTLLPEKAEKGIKKTMKNNGIDIDIDNLQAEDLDQLIDALSEIEVNIHDGDDKVRVYCE